MFDHYDCKFVTTSFDSNVRLNSKTGRTVSQLEYAWIIGYLMYAVISTRLDINFVGKLVGI